MMTTLMPEEQADIRTIEQERPLGIFERTLLAIIRRLDARLASEARLREALRLAGERLHGLSSDPLCMVHVFDDCPRYTCQEIRAALAEPTG